MTLITYHGRPAAMAGRERFYLAPCIDELPDGHALKNWVCALVLYARDVLNGEVPDLHYLPHRAERYARAALMPEREFRNRAHHADHKLAAHFNVPLEQVPRRRADLATASMRPGRLASVSESRRQPPDRAR
jgi:hypothetical protein